MSDVHHIHSPASSQTQTQVQQPDSSPPAAAGGGGGSRGGTAPAATAAGGGVSSRKVTRSRLGCQTCRARKVRCDERPGRCFNCERLGLVCAPSSRGIVSDPHVSLSLQQTETPRNFIGAGLKRKRTYRSCSDCRSSKTRCSGHKPTCARCLQKSLPCTYEDTSEPGWKQRVTQPSPHHSPEIDVDLADADLTPEAGTRSIGHSDGTTSSASLGLVLPGRSSHARGNTATEDLSWLVAASLPDHAQTRALVERYFANIHPLRCFAFLHKPSFMQKLDNDSDRNHDSNALLHIVCALGALFYAVEYENERRVALPFETLSAGNKWAKHAQNLILASLDKISVENLMAAVLLHDYELRMGNYANAFMLSAITARMAQALQINLEHSTDVLCRDNIEKAPPASVKESRRRLMWCCYITDSLVGSGIDQLTLIDEADIKIQLPCNEQSFTLENPCITETLEPGQMLRFLPPELLPTYPADNMGMTAFYLRHIALRRRVLKYIKHLDTASPPWLPDSSFAKLDAECRNWYDTLPANLQFTPTTLYIRQETSQVGALCALHHAYHQTMCDLYRVAAPDLYKLRSAFSFPPEQINFLRHLQTTLFEHAKSLATIIAVAIKHGSHAIADSMLPTTTYDSCRIMLYHLTQLIDPNAESSKVQMAETLPHIRNNVKALKMMRSMYAQAEPLSKAADTMLQKVGLGSDGQSVCHHHNLIPDDPYSNTEADDAIHSAPGTPAQSAPDYVLNPLSIYRLARKSIPEKHAPERQPSSMSCSTPARPHNTSRTNSHPDIPMPDHSHEGGSMMGNDMRGDMSTAEFEELQSIFTSDPLGWTWAPAETAVSSRIEANSLPPWESASIHTQLDAWLPSFSLEP